MSTTIFFRLLQGDFMKTTETLIKPVSEYFIYTPTQEAFFSYLYPVCIGHFVYCPGYVLNRNSYDSILIMHVTSGKCTVHARGIDTQVSAGSTVLINCYEPHGYESNCGWEADWIHIDGTAALNYYDYLSKKYDSCTPVLNKAPSGLASLIADFSNGTIPAEAIMSMILTGMLADFAAAEDSTDRQNEENAMADQAGCDNDVIALVTGYINSHFTEELSTYELASYAGLSRYYFIRLFKKRTGCTPHEYLINTRLNHAKYLLKNTGLTIKEICFASGFADESRFCTCFRNCIGVRPSEYRMK